MYKVTHKNGQVEWLKSTKELKDALPITDKQIGELHGGKEIQAASFLGTVTIKKR